MNMYKLIKKIKPINIYNIVLHTMKHEKNVQFYQDKIVTIFILCRSLNK